jgi:hypothetical protein
MRQAYFEDEGSCGVCPILEDTDLDAMTDEQLQAELSNWVRQASDDCPLRYVVEDNIRLVERHIELRGMTDEDLARDLDQAEWAVGYWTEKFAEDKCPRTRNTIAHRERQAEDYRREQLRRAGLVEVVEDDVADAEEEADVIVLPNGVFLFPNRVPADMPHDERSEEEMRIWWGRPFITENEGSDQPYIIQRLDGGACDRPTYKGSAATVKEAIAIANSLLA